MNKHFYLSVCYPLLLGILGVVPAFGQSLKTLQSDSALRMKTNVVTLNVNVVDRHGKPMVGLERQQFEVYEDGVKQNLNFFSQSDSPASVVVVFDRSTSMQLLLPRSRQALASFVQNSHADDEYFLIAFNQKVELLLESSDGESLLRRFTPEHAEGDTSLYDAIAKGLEKLRQAKHSKRALLILSDGVDTSSRTSYHTLMNAAKETNCQLFFIGSADILSAGCSRFCQMQTFNRMQDLANLTGGQAFFLTRPHALENAITNIALLLRQQYSLGYSPTNAEQSGKWRKIDVKVTLTELKSRVFTRKGYYDRLENGSE